MSRQSVRLGTLDVVIGPPNKRSEAMSTINAISEKSASTNRTEKWKLGVFAPGNKSSTGTSASDPAIWRRAYQKWEAAGNPAGDGVRFWSDAAQEIREGK